MKPSILLDANASVPVLPAACEAYFAASREHPYALAAAYVQARTVIAESIGANADDMMFTSGGTEADALAIWGVLQHQPSVSHIVTSSIEHAAIAANIDAYANMHGMQVTRIQADRSGVIDIAALAACLAQHPQAAYASMVYACNETGVIQPIEAIAKHCMQHGTLLHTDAIQAVGKLPIDVRKMGIDLLSLSGHKIGAPGGIGALYVKRGIPVQPLCGQLHDNMPGVIALAVAMQHTTQVHQQMLQEQRDVFEVKLQQLLSYIEIVGQLAPRLGHTSCIRFDGCEAEGLMMALDIEGFATSTGSACSSGSISASPILLGMGLSSIEAKQVLRFSWSAPLSHADLTRLIDTIVRLVRSMRGA